MNRVEWVGLVAGSLTTLAFVPQLVQVWRSRSARDINLGTFCLFCLGVAVWLVYGVLLGATAVILSNAVTLLLACVILVLKIHFSRLARRLPEPDENRTVEERA